MLLQCFVSYSSHFYFAQFFCCCYAIILILFLEGVAIIVHVHAQYYLIEQNTYRKHRSLIAFGIVYSHFALIHELVILPGITLYCSNNYSKDTMDDLCLVHTVQKLLFTVVRVKVLLQALE